MGVLNLYTKFSVPSDINRNYICPDWSMIWASARKCMKILAMTKKNYYSHGCSAKSYFHYFFQIELGKTFFTWMSMSSSPFHLLKNTPGVLCSRNPIFPNVFNHATGNVYNYRQNKYNHCHDPIIRDASAWIKVEMRPYAGVNITDFL